MDPGVSCVADGYDWVGYFLIVVELFGFVDGIIDAMARGIQGLVDGIDAFVGCFFDGGHFLAYLLASIFVVEFYGLTVAAGVQCGECRQSE